MVSEDPPQGHPPAPPPRPDSLPPTNGAHHPPPGGPRLSLRGLDPLATLSLPNRTVGAILMLTPESKAALRHTVWHYDPEKENIENYDGTFNARATGLWIISGKTEADRLFDGDGRVWFGHFGEAYGLLAGVWVDPETGDGVIFALTGTAFDPEAERDGKSTLYPIEARILEQLGRILNSQF